ncbi:MAG: FKBP-type peptidyl-prolyl cis-trans isomerase [Prevotella sp.]|nr:FKBP-type peptidyl-prolyl cis-trans isomerase [Prevotella sp.]
MKKLIMLAAVVVLGASLSTATAGKKDKKKKTQTEQVAETPAEEPVVLATFNDSLSYAAGKTATNGLIPYLVQQLKVDTAYMADFVKGFSAATQHKDDPVYAAYQAGVQIAQMANQRILPSMKADFEGSDKAIAEDLFYKGFMASLMRDNSIYSDSAALSFFDKTNKEVKEQVAQEYKQKNVEWLAENAKKEGVQTLPSGLQYKVITMGEGEKPQKDQTVEVKYEGKMIDGTVFDSSYKRNPQTSKFRCDQVIKGWTEALLLMPVGSKWELYIPQELAYGERQAGNIKPFSTLIFTVELMGIEASKDIKPDTKVDLSKALEGKKLPTIKRTVKKK